MVRTQIQLTEEQALKLRSIAASRHISLAEVVRQAVDSAIKSTPVTDIEEKRKRAIAAAGRFSSGLHDLSAEHDKYLDDAFADK